MGTVHGFKFCGLAIQGIQFLRTSRRDSRVNKPCGEFRSPCKPLEFRAESPTGAVLVFKAHARHGCRALEIGIPCVEAWRWKSLPI